MANQISRDQVGREIGRIKESASGRLRAYDNVGRRVGSYNPKTNKTYDQIGREFGTGNQLAALIAQASK